MGHQHIRSLVRDHAVLIALVAVGCRGDDKPPPTQTVQVHRDGKATETISVPTSLWTLCDDPEVAIVANGPKGFVRGECKQSKQLALDVDVAGDHTRAVLRRVDTDIVVATAEPIESIHVVRDVPEPAVELTPLRIQISGKPSVSMTPEKLASLAGPRRTRRGTQLRAVLHDIGLEPQTIAAVVIHGTTDYEVDPAWLTSDDQDLLLRHNRRGVLRFGHTTGGTERARISPVETIEVKLRR